VSEDLLLSDIMYLNVVSERHSAKIAPMHQMSHFASRHVQAFVTTVHDDENAFFT